MFQYVYSLDRTGGGLARAVNKLASGMATCISLYPDSTELSSHVPLHSCLCNMIVLMSGQAEKRALQLRSLWS